MVSRERELIVTACSAFVRPHLVLCPAMRTRVQEGCGAAGKGTEEDHKDDQRSEASPKKKG